MNNIKKTKLEFMTMMSKIGKQWGLGEPVGKVWGLLLFEDQSLSQREIANECNYSLSLVSPSLTFLEKMGLIGIVEKRGREKMYAATLSFLEGFEKILRNFMQLSVDPVIDLLSEIKNTGDKKVEKKLEKVMNEYKKTVILSNFFLNLIKTKKALDIKQLSKLFGRGGIRVRPKALLDKMPTIR